MVTSAYYGIVAEPIQPTGGAGAQPNPEGSTSIATVAAPGRLGVVHQAGFWIVEIGRASCRERV